MGTLSITNGEISILNVGIMGVITTLNSYSNPKATLDYRSICKTNCSAGVDNVIFKNYGLQLTRMANDFNNNKYDITSRISVSKNASFYDANSKIILDFGGNFEFGKEYLTNMLILGNNNNPFVNLVEFYRLSLQNPDIYKLTQSGDYFIVNELSGGEIHTPITESNKNNVAIMNNFFLTKQRYDL